MTLDTTPLCIEVRTAVDETCDRPAWDDLVSRAGTRALHCGSGWLAAVCDGFGHEPHVLVATQGDRMVGILPLAFVKSLLFGRFLVSVPYVNSGGVIAEDPDVAAALIDRAVELADELDVRYLELRHDVKHEHPALTHELTSKAQMRMPLPSSKEDAWKQVRSVVRTQVRKSEKQGLTVQWGKEDLLSDFYTVFSRNMRDLGTPVFSRRLFRSIFTHLPEDAELCVLHLDKRPIAGALAVHVNGVTEVPSASVLRAYRSTAANSLMYWRAIERAIERGQSVFDFGRSTIDGSTYAFKKKWGAQPEPAVWQYYLRKGDVADMRPESGKYNRRVKIWQRLPVPLTRLIGPPIIRGIP